MSTFNIAVKRRDPIDVTNTILNNTLSTIYTVPSGEYHLVRGIAFTNLPITYTSLIFQLFINSVAHELFDIAAASTAEFIKYGSGQNVLIMFKTPVSIKGGDVIRIRPTGNSASSTNFRFISDSEENTQ